MFIRIALYLLALAICLLALATALSRLAAPLLPEGLAWLGSAMLLSAFSVLILTGLAAAGRVWFRHMRAFFSARQRQQRRVLALKTRQQQQDGLLALKTAQIRYFHELQKKRLQAVDNRTQLQALARAVVNNLALAKKRLPKAVIKDLQNERRRSLKRRDGAALLKLQEKITLLLQTCPE